MRADENLICWLIALMTGPKTMNKNKRTDIEKVEFIKSVLYSLITVFTFLSLT